MSAAKLPKWAQAIGSMLAEQFGVSDEPLPLEMDLMLRLFSDDPTEDTSVGEKSEVRPGTDAPRSSHGEAKPNRD
jgi:hypothetical protein